MELDVVQLLRNWTLFYRRNPSAFGLGLHSVDALSGVVIARSDVAVLSICLLQSRWFVEDRDLSLWPCHKGIGIIVARSDWVLNNCLLSLLKPASSLDLRA